MEQEACKQPTWLVCWREPSLPALILPITDFSNQARPFYMST